MKIDDVQSDTVIVKFTEYFSSLAILNVLWLVSSLLLIPLFAATEAVFYSIYQYTTNRTHSVTSTFMEYVKQNVWASMKRGLPFLLILIILLVDLAIVYTMPDSSPWRLILAGALLVLTLLFVFFFFYYYCFLYSTKGTDRKRIIQSFYTLFRYIHYNLLLLLLIGGQVVLGLYFPPLFFFFSLSFPVMCFTYATQKMITKKPPQFFS